MQIFMKVPNPNKDVLDISHETEDMIVYDPFILENPKTAVTFPEFDEPYYTSLEMQLRHLLYKYEKGWITSPRQVINSSDECISTIHFLFDEHNKVKKVNVFQRSSNILNLEEDIQFLNYFINKYIKSQTDLVVLVSIPHFFKNKLRKIEE